MLEALRRLRRTQSVRRASSLTFKGATPVISLHFQPISLSTSPAACVVCHRPCNTALVQPGHVHKEQVYLAHLHFNSIPRLSTSQAVATEGLRNWHSLYPNESPASAPPQALHSSSHPAQPVVVHAAVSCPMSHSPPASRGAYCMRRRV